VTARSSLSFATSAAFSTNHTCSSGNAESRPGTHRTCRSSGCGLAFDFKKALVGLRVDAFWQGIRGDQPMFCSPLGGHRHYAHNGFRSVRTPPNCLSYHYRPLNMDSCHWTLSNVAYGRLGRDVVSKTDRHCRDAGAHPTVSRTLADSPRMPCQKGQNRNPTKAFLNRKPDRTPQIGTSVSPGSRFSISRRAGNDWLEKSGTVAKYDDRGGHRKGKRKPGSKQPVERHKARMTANTMIPVTNATGPRALANRHSYTSESIG